MKRVSIQLQPEELDFLRIFKKPEKRSQCEYGRARWILQLPSQQLKGIDGMESITHESVRLILKKMNVSPD